MKEIYIKKNTPELLEKLKEIGYEICTCCNFKDSMWLNTYENKVHGVGYSDEVMPMTIEEALNFFEEDIDDYNCEQDEDLFLKLAKENYERKY